MAKRANRLPPPLSQASLGYANVTLKRRVHKFNIQASVACANGRLLPLAVLIRKRLMDGVLNYGVKLL
jgi:hypothetical protein